MRRIFDRIRNSEFLTFSEVLRLKVSIVTVFLAIFIGLTIPLSSFSEFSLEEDVFIPLLLVFLVLLSALLLLVNLNRFAMHISIIATVALTWYFNIGVIQFYSYIMFFVTLTIIIFYQDILTYLLYGGIATGIGVYYIILQGSQIIGSNTLDAAVSTQTYLVILIGFYLVFLIQFLISDNIYEKMNNEWVRMNKVLERYQDFSFQNLKEMLEENDTEPIYRTRKFQQTVSELSIFINEFFEKDASKIAEVVEYYFFLHDQEVETIVENKEASILARKYAAQFDKYLINKRTELVSMLFDFATLFKPSENYHDKRYKYHLDELFTDRIDKLLALAIIYKYLKTEITQFDKWGNVKRILNHEEITELITSKDFREFISYEQVNFYLDNQELFEKHL